MARCLSSLTGAHASLSLLCRHLAASEGCYKVTEWLIDLGSDVNALDRFKRTPLEVCDLSYVRHAAFGVSK